MVAPPGISASGYAPSNSSAGVTVPYSEALQALPAPANWQPDAKVQAWNIMDLPVLPGWVDDSHVRDSLELPCDAPTVWSWLRARLLQAPQPMTERAFADMLRGYCPAPELGDPGSGGFAGLKRMLSDYPETASSFFESTLPFIVEQALQVETRAGRARPPMLKSTGPARSVTLDRQLLLSLLACSFLALLAPRYDKWPLACSLRRGDADGYHRSLPDPRFIRLLTATSPQEVAKLRMVVHYFERCQYDRPFGQVVVHRTRCPPKDWVGSRIRMLPLRFRWPEDHSTEEPECVQALPGNLYVGGGVLSGGASREEATFASRTECLVSLLLCTNLRDDEAVQVVGAERFSEVTGMGYGLGFAGSFIDPAQRSAAGTLCTAVTVMDAMDFRQPRRAVSLNEQLDARLVLRELTKVAAACGFSDDHVDRLPVATTDWGAGAFAGSAELKILLQWVAASEVGRDLVYIPAVRTREKADLLADLQRCSEALEQSQATVGDVVKALQRVYCLQPKHGNLLRAVQNVIRPGADGPSRPHRGCLEHGRIQLPAAAGRRLEVVAAQAADYPEKPVLPGAGVRALPASRVVQEADVAKPKRQRSPRARQAENKERPATLFDAIRHRGGPSLQGCSDPRHFVQWRERVLEVERMDLGRLRIAMLGGVLPVLPRLEPQLPKRLEGPTFDSNYVLAGKLLVGAYPGSTSEPEHTSRVEDLLNAGVETFICLATTDELMHFMPYVAVARQLLQQGAAGTARSRLEFVHCPMEDGSVGALKQLREAVSVIVDRLGHNRSIYIHCIGGHSRPGTLICAFLVKVYGLTAEQAACYYNIVQRAQMEQYSGGASLVWPHSREQLLQVQELQREGLQALPTAILPPLEDWDVHLRLDGRHVPSYAPSSFGGSPRNLALVEAASMSDGLRLGASAGGSVLTSPKHAAIAVSLNASVAWSGSCPWPRPETLLASTPGALSPRSQHRPGTPRVATAHVLALPPGAIGPPPAAIAVPPAQLQTGFHPRGSSMAMPAVLALPLR